MTDSCNDMYSLDSLRARSSPAGTGNVSGIPDTREREKLMGTSSDVPALRRGLAILRMLAAHAGPQSAAAIARQLALPRPTTNHLLAELLTARFVAHLLAT